MKKILTSLTVFGLIFLLILNILFFYFSLKLSDQITYYEIKTSQLHDENINLEKELAEVSSLNYAKKLAEVMNFKQKSQAVFLDNFIYAFALLQ
ncbi:MAG: hypothetical protein ACPLRN_02660 [Microgenomates group bacterium]